MGIKPMDITTLTDQLITDIKHESGQGTCLKSIDQYFVEVGKMCGTKADYEVVIPHVTKVILIATYLELNITNPHGWFQLLLGIGKAGFTDVELRQLCAPSHAWAVEQGYKAVHGS